MQQGRSPLDAATSRSTVGPHNDSKLSGFWPNEASRGFPPLGVAKSPLERRVRPSGVCRSSGQMGYRDFFFSLWGSDPSSDFVDSVKNVCAVIPIPA